MVKKAEGTDRAFFWGTDFSTQGYMKWTLVKELKCEVRHWSFQKFVRLTLRRQIVNV